MRLTISSRRDIAVLQKESSSLEGDVDVKTYEASPLRISATWLRTRSRKLLSGNLRMLSLDLRKWNDVVCRSGTTCGFTNLWIENKVGT
jgi:hypothetical protein